MRGENILRSLVHLDWRRVGRRLAGFSLVLGGLASIVGVVGIAYFVWWIVFADEEAYRGRFLLRVTVEVDGERRTGESVYEAAYNSLGESSRLRGGVILGSRGTMPWVDLGDLGVLVLVFEPTRPWYGYERDVASAREPRSCIQFGTAKLPTVGMVAQDKYGDWNTTRRAKEAMRTTQRFELTEQLSPKRRTGYPGTGAILYRRDDLDTYWRTFKLCDLQYVTKGRAHVVSLTIENTDRELRTRIPDDVDWMRTLRADLREEAKMNWERAVAEGRDWRFKNPMKTNPTMQVRQIERKVVGGP